MVRNEYILWLILKEVRTHYCFILCKQKNLVPIKIMYLSPILPWSKHQNDN